MVAFKLLYSHTPRLKGLSGAKKKVRRKQAQSVCSSSAAEQLSLSSPFWLQCLLFPERFNREKLKQEEENEGKNISATCPVGARARGIRSLLPQPWLPLRARVSQQARYIEDNYLPLLHYERVNLFWSMLTFAFVFVLFFWKHDRGNEIELTILPFHTHTRRRRRSS